MAEPGHYGAPHTVNANLLPDWLSHASSRFGVIGPDSWKVTENTSMDRGVQFNIGRGWSDGILTEFDSSNITQPFSLPAQSATKYFMIVSRVNWQVPLTRTFVAVEGSAERSLPVGSLNYQREPGVIADFPVALVQVQADSARLGEIIDLRVWRGDNGILMAHSDLVMQYLDRPGTVVDVNGVRSTLQLDGTWKTTHYAEDAEPMIFRSLVMAGSMHLPNGQYTTIWNMRAHGSDRPAGITFSGGKATIQKAGLYEMDGQVTFAGGDVGLRAVNFLIDGIHPHRAFGQGTGVSSLTVRNHFLHYLTPGATVELQAWQSSGKSMTLPGDGDVTRWTIRRVAR